jgi:hypothetical protein
MQEELITFETAKLAKEKGFIIPCENYYVDYVDDDVVDLFNYEEQRGSGFAELCRNNLDYKTSAPTQSLLQKWLREVHNIEVLINRIPPEAILSSKKNGKSILNNYNCYVWSLNNNPRIANNGSFHETYEEALEVELQEALKLISIVKGHKL